MPSELEDDDGRLCRLPLAPLAAGVADTEDPESGLDMALGLLGLDKDGGRSACMNLKDSTLYQRRDTLRGLKSARLTCAQPCQQQHIDLKIIVIVIII
jgi:hypothetical protein